VGTLARKSGHLLSKDGHLSCECCCPFGCDGCADTYTLTVAGTDTTHCTACMADLDGTFTLTRLTTSAGCCIWYSEPITCSNNGDVGFWTVSCVGDGTSWNIVFVTYPGGTDFSTFACDFNAINDPSITDPMFFSSVGAANCPDGVTYIPGGAIDIGCDNTMATATIAA
jgi:hypothetical protein